MCSKILNALWSETSRTYVYLFACVCLCEFFSHFHKNTLKNFKLNESTNMKNVRKPFWMHMQIKFGRLSCYKHVTSFLMIKENCGKNGNINSINEKQMWKRLSDVSQGFLPKVLRKNNRISENMSLLHVSNDPFPLWERGSFYSRRFFTSSTWPLKITAKLSAEVRLITIRRIAWSLYIYFKFISTATNTRKPKGQDLKMFPTWERSHVDIL